MINLFPESFFRKIIPPSLVRKVVSHSPFAVLQQLLSLYVPKILPLYHKCKTEQSKEHQKPSLSLLGTLLLKVVLSFLIGFSSV